MRLLLRDLFFHLKRMWCLVRRSHRDARYVGELTKRGFRGVPMYQCVFCVEFYLREVDLKKLGGKTP